MIANHRRLEQPPTTLSGDKQNFGVEAITVNHLVPKGQARARAAEIATTIAQNGPIAVRQAKKAIAYGMETDLDTAMILAIEAYNATVVTEDRLEGVRAFNEKRKPNYKGR